MIGRIGLALVTAIASLILSGSPSHADQCHWVEQSQLIDGAIQIQTVQVCGSGGGSGGSVNNPIDPIRDSDWDAVCVRTALEIGADPVDFCAMPPQAIPTLQITPGLVARAFRRIDLPASELVVQPPGGTTLVNFETNFYTEQGEFTRTVRLLGRRVDLRIWPSEFRWDFGDGASLSSESAGAAYPDLEITHDYARKGVVSPSVDTTYAAEFRVDGGPWRDVAGTVTIAGQPAQLEVTTARPVLVGSR